MQRALVIVAVGAVLTLLGCHYLWRAEPWDESHNGVNSGGYYGYACRGLAAHGFFAKRMQGPALFHPDTPDIWEPYANHPGTAYLLIYPCYLYLGRDEAALRWAMGIVCALTLLLFAMCLRRFLSPPALAASVALLASPPLMFQYGNMVDLPLFCLMLFAPTLVAWQAWRAGRTRYGVYFALAFAAGMIDWFSYFLVPGILLVDNLAAGTLRERLARAWRVGLPFAVSLVVVGAWLGWALGGDALRSHFATLFGAMHVDIAALAPHAVVDGQALPYFPSIGRHLERTFGLPLLALGVVGLVRALVELRRAPAARIAVAGLVAGVLPAVAFRIHAIKHEFWFMTAAGSIAMLAAGALFGFSSTSPSFGPRRRILAFVIVAAVTGFGVVKGIELHDGYRTTTLRERGVALGERFGERDLVLISFGLSSDRFYSRAVTVPGVTTREVYDEVRRIMRPHRDEFDRVSIVWSLGERADFQWLLALPRLDPGVPGRTDFGRNGTVVLEIGKDDFFAAD
ncbi:MAG: hypothetical protein R3F20_00245 [Planctomycetota bacterium]